VALIGLGAANAAQYVEPVRTALIAMAALVVGILGALGYSHFLGEGLALANLQDDLGKTKADLASAKQEIRMAKSEHDAMSAQIQQLDSTKEDLQRQLDDAKGPAAASTDGAPAANPMSAMIKANLTQQYQEKLDLLIKRLHLTPDQIAKVKAAMDDEAKLADAMTAKMLSGGKVDPAAMKGMKSVEMTLNDILTPDQKTGYEQMKAEQKSSAAEMMASVEMNQMTTALQLNDTQKDQVYNALYQVQISSEDPNWVKNNVNTSDPTSILDAQAKAREDALSKILTPDQLSTYHQQTQAQLNMQKAMMKNFMPAGTPGASAATVHTSP
jgi:chromosome segregation ATPase